MAKTTKKRSTGKPKALEEADNSSEEHNPLEPTMEEFVRDLHGTAATPQDGMPPMVWLKEQFESKSAMVRFLVHEGFEVKRIAKHLDMRYQHVRNVATSPLKRGPNEDWRKPLLENTNLPNSKEFKPPLPKDPPTS